MGLNKQMETLIQKEKPFKCTGYFLRTADANAYAINDAITNSTSSPSILTISLSSYGVSSGDFIAITNVRVVESTKLSGASINTWVLPNSFTSTNDNAELALSDSEVRDGLTIPCLNLYTTANNSKIVSDPGFWVMQLSNSNIYVILQAASAFTGGNNARYDVIIEGVILK